MSSDFGITVPCYWGDIDLLEGCVNSIKTFYPDLDICLIPHGKINIEHLVKRYGCTFVDPSHVDAELRAKSYGYGLTKMLAFWYAPFERFLHIDADTICWGRYFEPEWFDCADLIANLPHELVTDELLRQQY